MDQDVRAAPEPLVGRWEERVELERLTASIGDGARVLLLIGPAGVGKTALWTYGRQAAGSLARVLTCRSAGPAARISYSGLSDLLVSLRAEMESLSSADKRALILLPTGRTSTTLGLTTLLWRWRLRACSAWPPPATARARDR
jgi:hypothetical protein